MFDYVSVKEFISHPPVANFCICATAAEFPNQYSKKKSSNFFRFIEELGENPTILIAFMFDHSPIS